MELSFLQLAVGFVVNFKHSDTIPSGNEPFQQLEPMIVHLLEKLTLDGVSGD
jgi:hypothetical protein